MFADDVSIFYPYKNDLVLKTQIERDASLIIEYARINGLVLNPDKTKLLRFRPHSPSINSDFSIYINGKLVREEHEIKYLGIVLKSNLSWDGHIKSLRAKISSASGLLFKLSRKLATKNKLLIYQSLIHSHLEYMAIVYAFKKTNELKILQSAQNKALKCVFNLDIRHNTIGLYKDYCKTIMPIYGLYKKQLLLYVYKSVHNIGSRFINLSVNQNICNTRNSSNLRIARCRLETTRQRIEYAGCVIFNNLPSNVKNCTSISIFKRTVKEYILHNIEILLDY